MRECVSSTSLMTAEKMIYYLMNEDDAFHDMSNIITQTNEILGLESVTVVRLLLNHFHWDRNILIERYWEDPEKIFHTLKLSGSNLLTKIDQQPQSSSINKCGTITCSTCYIERPAHEHYSLFYHHQHCLRCWRLYLQSKILNNADAKPILCPSHCNQIVDDEQIFLLLSNNTELKKRFQKLLVNIYVETNPLTKWCPGKDCPTIVKLESTPIDSAHVIHCDECKTAFCFQCLHQWHDPVQCSLLEKWDKKNRDESMTCEWIIANTKDCPNCRSSIEKNGGCNHMTCRKLGCGHEFCWICLKPWKEHATQQCNVFQDDRCNGNQLAARENLARYMHYFTRYQIHNQSLELENELSNKVKQLILKMQTESKSYTEQQAIYKAFDVLRECRRTLKYTYAFAYYLYRNNQAEVFEQNQADLERETEALSGLLEQVTGVDPEMSMKVMNKTSYCNRRRQVLLDHCKEGYTEHYWGGLDPY